MKYMLLIYDDEKAFGQLSESERNQVFSEYFKFTEEIKSSGNYIGGDQFQPTSAAARVRVRDGRQSVTDGPFAATPEQLGGYYLIEAKDLAEASGIAARIPSARMGTVEVRPVVGHNSGSA